MWSNYQISSAVPPNKIFVHVNPVQVHFHLDSCLWLNSFVLNLHESLLRTAVMNTDAATAQQRNDQSANPTTEPPNLMYMDVKLEVIMPRVSVNAHKISFRFLYIIFSHLGHHRVPARCPSSTRSPQINADPGVPPGVHQHPRAGRLAGRPCASVALVARGQPCVCVGLSR